MNILENVLAGGETEIKKLEDDIRMIKIKLTENSRKIDVATGSIEVLRIPAE